MGKEDQKDLPGMEDRELKDLTELAREYVKIRDKRQDFTKREVELKRDILNLMHKHKKETYDFKGIHVEIVVEEESVKVSVKDKNETAASAGSGN